MSESFFPRLCGGTFFTLITHAMKIHGRSRDTVRGVSGGITEAECFKGLIRVFYPALPNLALSTEKSNATHYKKCENLSQGIIPFSDLSVARNYGRLLMTDYAVPLRRMAAFVEQFIDVEGHGEWLVRAILQLIKEDQSISHKATFFINPDGTGVSKRELESLTQFYLQPFLLGVWSAIVRNVPDNTIGHETFLQWHPSARNKGNGSKHQFISDIGTTDTHSISISMYDVPGVQVAEALVDEPGEKLSGKYADYLVAARRKFETIKTIMDEAPKPFYDFYVCNGLMYKRFVIRTPEDEESILGLNPYIPDPTIDTLSSITNYLIIEGTGGLGKSMMMRHLMMNTIDRVDFIGKLPIFVTLKDYNRSNLELTDFIFEQFSILNPSANRDVFMAGLSEGPYALFLDGLDEINSTFQGQFDRMISNFVDSYGGNIIVMSSRPISKFTRFEKFFEMQLVPFTKDKALQLIDKLKFHPEEPDFKKKFRDALENRLFNTHKEFAENPLLLTFMLMTFERFGEVATQMHTFYEEVYDLLSKRHDALKVGFTRAYKSGLTPDRLKDIFAAFCAHTYADQKYNLTQHEMESYLSQILSQLRDERERLIPPADLIQDITSAVCMMYEEGQEYHFMHRSFQEYFCALSFSKQMDEDLKDIGDFFENRSRNQRSDKTFKMFYDMIPEHVDKYILIPFLEDLFTKCDSADGYWTFVKKMYHIFYYDYGETEGETYLTSDSFLFNFMADKFDFLEQIEPGRLPFYESLVENEYVHMKLGKQTVVIDKRGVPSDEYMELDEDGHVNIVGWTMVVNVDDLLKQKDRFKELISAMEKEDFAFMKEYSEAKKLLSTLKLKYGKPKKNLVNVI